MYNSSKTLVSIIIPSFNEANNIENLINKFAKNLEKVELKIYRKDVEIIVVNNGSTDNSKKILDDLKDRFSFLKVVNVKTNQGYGYGIKNGFNICDGEFIGWTHADLQIDPSDVIYCVDKLLSLKNRNLKFIKANRTNRSLSQKIFTKGMSFLCSVLFVCNIRDINSHPNIYPKKIISTFIDPPNDFSFDFYFYLLAKKCGLEPIKPKIVVHHRQSGLSKWDFKWDSKLRLILSIASYVLKFRLKFKRYKELIKNFKTAKVPNKF